MKLYNLGVNNHGDVLQLWFENDVMDFMDCYDYMGDDYYPEPKPFTLEVVE